MTGGVWLTPVLQDLNSKHCLLKGRRERGKYHPPPHTPRQLINYTPRQPATSPQTLHSRWASLLLQSNSFQDYPVFTSTPFTPPGFSALCTLASSHLKPVSRVTDIS